MSSLRHVLLSIRTNLLGLAISLTLASGTSHGAPTISGVSGTVIEDRVISISGSGFGTGPNVVLYDDFNGGSIGQAISLAGSVGTWTGTVSKAPIYSNTARSGTTSMRTYYDGKVAQFRKDFATPATEILLSFWVRIPDGTPFPGSTGGIRKFSSDSSWKMAWLIDSSYDGSTSDLCIPTHIGSGSFYFAGNDYSLVKLPNGSNWWSWDSWMRITVWLKASTSSPAASGNYQFQVVSQERGLMNINAAAPIFDADGPTEKVYRYLNLPGWIRTDGTSQPVYDDVYIATGANAQARIEIGDAPTYSASKHLAMLIPQSWSTSSIAAKLPSASLVKQGTAYLYVTDKDGQVNAEGFPLSSAVAPSAPTMLTVN